MEWWQIVLILVAAVVIGGIVGVLLSYLILRFFRKNETTFLSDLITRFPKKSEAAPAVIAETEVRTEEKTEAETEVKTEAKAETGAAAKAEFSAPDLLAEVKSNYAIAAEPIGDKLSTFQTDVWDAHHFQIDRLPAEVRDDLEQVYTDIRLANSLAWLSTEFSRRTPSLEENYTKLCSNIVEKLSKVMALLEQPGKE